MAYEPYPGHMVIPFIQRGADWCIACAVPCGGAPYIPCECCQAYAEQEAAAERKQEKGKTATDGSGGRTSRSAD